MGAFIMLNRQPDGSWKPNDIEDCGDCYDDSAPPAGAEERE
jgi:hypothetical protein